MRDVKYRAGGISYMDFEDEIKAVGNSGRLIVPKELIGKKVRVRLSVL